MPGRSVARASCGGLLDGLPTWRRAICPRRVGPPIPAGTAASLRRMSAAAADLPLIASGQGPRDVRRWATASADGRQRPHLDLRRRASDADPGQGHGADRPVGVLVRQDRPHRRQPPHLGDRGRARRRARPRDGRPPAGDAARSSASCAATSPARAGRTTRRPARSPGSSCRPACASPSGCRADLHAVHEGRDRATTRRSTSTARPSSSATATLMERVRDVSIELYSFAAEPRARARRDPRRHEVRVRPRRRAASSSSATRCSRPTPRATGRPTATSRAAASRASTSSTCATGRAGSGWDKTPPAPEIPDGRRRGHARALRRGLRADHRRAVRRLAGAHRAHEGAGAHPARRRASSIRRASRSSARCRRSGFTGVVERPRRPARRARRRGPVRSSTPMCRRSCSPTR